MIVRATTAPPIAIDPVSPINTDAGLELKYKNPTRTANIMIANSLVVPLVDRIYNAKNTGKDTLEAKPSSPSVKFTAFVVPTIINTRIGKPRKLTFNG